MFEEEYRQEMQKTAPSDFARDALLKEMDTLRYRPKQPPVRAIAAVLTALVLLSALALPADRIEIYPLAQNDKEGT